MKRVIVLFGFLLALPTPGRAGVDCGPAVCAVEAALNAECSCAAATNHGQHVRCVAHAVKDLSDAGMIPTKCKGKVKKCAARSICGKPGSVICDVPQLDICDLTTGTCLDKPDMACALDADCTTIQCKTKSSAEKCLAAGGMVSTSTTCCPGCAP